MKKWLLSLVHMEVISIDDSCVTLKYTQGFHPIPGDLIFITDIHTAYPTQRKNWEILYTNFGQVRADSSVWINIPFPDNQRPYRATGRPEYFVTTPFIPSKDICGWNPKLYGSVIHVDSLKDNHVTMSIFADIASVKLLPGDKITYLAKRGK